MPCGAGFAVLGTAVLLLVSCSTGVNGYSSGPPAEICINQQPFHFVSGFTAPYHPGLGGPPRYAINVNSSTWVTGGTLIVTLIGATAGREFEGFIMKAVRASNQYTNAGLSPLLGSFACTTSTGASAKYHSVYTTGGENNCVSHGQANDYKNVTCVWTAPETNEGPIMFVATVVAEYNQYQTQIQSTTLDNINGTANFTMPSDVMTAAEKPAVFGCGTTKTCALYPPSCDVRGGCKYGVMMTPKGSAGVMFEVFGTTFDWLAVGLGASTEMANLEVFSCGYDPKKNKAVLYYGFAPAKYFFAAHRFDVTMVKALREVNSGDTIASLPVQPNTIYCQFMRPVDTTFVYYDYNFTSRANKPVTVVSNLSGQGRYVVLAQGQNIPNTPNLGKHTHIPLRSPNRFSATGSPSTMYFEGMEKSVQTHGTLMTIFWLFLCGSGIILARHTRPVLTQQVAKKQIWFLLHAALMVLGYVIAIAGVVYILVKEGGWESDSQTHGIIGLIGMGLGLINIIAGIFRPHPGTRFRPVFNRLHRWNGMLAFLFAGVAIWLGATFESHRPEFRFWAIIVLAIWSGLQIIFMVGFECARQRAVRNKKQEYAINKRFKMSDMSTSAQSVSDGTASNAPLENEQEPVIKGKQLVHIGEVWIVTYAIIFLALAAAFWSGLWIH